MLWETASRWRQCYCVRLELSGFTGTSSPGRHFAQSWSFPPRLSPDSNFHFSSLCLEKEGGASVRRQVPLTPGTRLVHSSVPSPADSDLSRCFRRPEFGELSS